MDDSSLNVELDLEFLVYQIQDLRKGSKNESDETYVDTTKEFQMMQIPAKGQLVLKCPFGVFKSHIRPTNFFPGFLP